MLWGTQHSIARNFGASSSRGWNGDGWRCRICQSFTLPDYFQVLEKVAIICEQCSDGFAGIDDTPAAKANNTVAGARPGARHPIADEIGCRLASDGPSFKRETFEQRQERPGTFRVAPDHHERAAAQARNE